MRWGQMNMSDRVTVCMIVFRDSLYGAMTIVDMTM